MRIGKMAKSIVAALFAAAVVVNAAVSDDLFTTTELVNSVLAVLGALGVYAVPNASQSEPRER